MLAPFTLEPIALPARSVHRIENAKGVRVSCVRGATWVTQERDTRDMILASGQSVVLDRPGSNRRAARAPTRRAGGSPAVDRAA